MSNPESFRSRRFSLAFAAAFGAVALSFASPALAQKKPKEKAPEEAPEAAADGEAPPVEMTPQEKQAAAVELFKEGQAALEAEDFTLAIEKFEAAYEYFPDAGLKVKIGEAYQRDGTATEDFDKIQKAVDAYKQYIEIATANPDQITEQVQQSIDGVNKRISQLEEALEREKEREQRLADEETQRLLDEKKAAEEAERQRLAELAQRKEMQFVINAGLLAGADQDLSGILRFSFGGLLSWEHFALEAHLGLDGFLRVDQDRGVKARSLTVVDLGARYTVNYRSIGPFVSAGAGFGLFTGKPNERKLVDDTASCGDQGDCAFDIDKNISARLGFGWGFEATETTTVALRLEVQGWAFSVDDEQGAGKPLASQIEKPQTALAIMAGLEFLQWM